MVNSRKTAISSSQSFLNWFVILNSFLEFALTMLPGPENYPHRSPTCDHDLRKVFFLMEVPLQLYKASNVPSDLRHEKERIWAVPAWVADHTGGSLIHDCVMYSSCSYTSCEQKSSATWVRENWKSFETVSLQNSFKVKEVYNRK